MDIRSKYIEEAARLIGRNIDWNILRPIPPKEYHYKKRSSELADKRYKNHKEAQAWMDKTKAEFFKDV